MSPTDIVVTIVGSFVMFILICVSVWAMYGAVAAVQIEDDLDDEASGNDIPITW